MTTVQVRWGIDLHHQGEITGPLGALWIDPAYRVPAFLNAWPASYATRREARTAATILVARAQRHSAGWRFRVVRLTIQVMATRTATPRRRRG